MLWLKRDEHAEADVSVRVGVYFRGQSLRKPAETTVTQEAARGIWESGLCEYSKSGKNIILTKIEAEIPRPSLSLTMGPNTTLQYVMGSQRHIAVVEAWG